jgi:hypothetical protein
MSTGEHHERDREMSENTKSIALAAVVIAALGATICYLVDKGAKAHPLAARPHLLDRVRAQSSLAPVVPVPQQVAGNAQGARTRYAAALQLRFQRRGKAVSFSAVGPEATTFRMTYPASGADEKHMEDIKRAEPFHREIRGRGFTRFEIWVGERQTWAKPL